MYWFAHDMGVPGTSTPLVTRMLRNVAGDAAATRQFLEVINHDLPPARLFTTGRMVRAAIGALHDRPGHAPATLREIASAVKYEVRRPRLTAGVRESSQKAR